jgi:hypothetical protein
MDSLFKNKENVVVEGWIEGDGIIVQLNQARNSRYKTGVLFYIKNQRDPQYIYI